MSLLASSMLIDTLKNIGLTSEQADIYLSLLSHGAQSAGQLAKSTKVQRTYIYKICQELIKKGLISQKKKARGTTFTPLSPDYLLSIAQEQKAKILEAQTSLEEVLPQLKDKFTSIEDKPIVKVFEGEDGIKKANLLVLAEKKEILTYLVINKEIDKKLADFWKKYYDIRIRDKIFVRAITPNTPEGIEYKNNDSKQLRITRLIPSDQFEFTIEKNIVGNKVAFFSIQGNKLVSTIIENKAIADTEKAIFELVWMQTEQYS